MDSAKMTSFGPVCRQVLGTQAQYGSRYLDGIHGAPDLGHGLRYYKGDTYHDCWIHEDDIAEFVRRYASHMADPVILSQLKLWAPPKPGDLDYRPFPSKLSGATPMS